MTTRHQTPNEMLPIACYFPTQGKGVSRTSDLGKMPPVSYQNLPRGRQTIAYLSLGEMPHVAECHPTPLIPCSDTHTGTIARSGKQKPQALSKESEILLLDLIWEEHHILRAAEGLTVQFLCSRSNGTFLRSLVAYLLVGTAKNETSEKQKQKKENAGQTEHTKGPRQNSSCPSRTLCNFGWGRGAKAPG